MSSVSHLMYQEECLEVFRNKKSMCIGLPKEHTFQEKRISLTPDAVGTIVANGHKILIESGAGVEANFSDKDYSDAGAEITADTKKVFSCPIILKVEPPTLDEIKLMSSKSLLFSVLQIKTQQRSYFEALSQKQITALAYENIQDEQYNYPILQSFSDIIGTATILIASELISDTNSAGGILFGNITGVPPVEVVIIGTDNIAEQAAKTALGLGAKIKIFGNSLTELRRIKNALPTQVFTSTIQPKILTKALMRCNVVIGSLRGKNRTPIVVTESMVARMKKGAAIIDACIDTGGFSETSKVTDLKNPTYIKNGVIHYCVPNIATKYARTASYSFSNIFTPYVLQIGEEGGIENLLQLDKGLRNGMYCYHGVFTNLSVCEWFDLPFRDVNLLFLK